MTLFLLGLFCPWVEVARAQDTAWCAAEFETLSAQVCARTTASPRASTLVIFLHGVIKPDTGWQHQQQRAIARAAQANGFDVIMPRGRRGIGPKTMRDWWTWPTAAKAQAEVGAELFAEWQTAKLELESRRGSAYAKVLVFGFSNGAYYASGLALSGALPAQGSAIFAGGAAGEWLERRAKGVQTRAPMYIEVGARDKIAMTDGRRLKQLLVRLGWPHVFVERPGSGHTMTDRGMKQAFDYLSRGSPGQ